MLFDWRHYRPHPMDGESNIFTGVCQFTRGRGSPGPVPGLAQGVPPVPASGPAWGVGGGSPRQDQGDTPRQDMGNLRQDSPRQYQRVFAMSQAVCLLWSCKSTFLFYGVFTLNDTENDICSETDEIAKSFQWHQWQGFGAV